MAYLNGYFESPRRCTGDELGEKLGISSQAVYQHIRAAERRLFDEAFRQILAVSTPGERFD
jgi:predicted DNA binding protein